MMKHIPEVIIEFKEFLIDKDLSFKIFGFSKLIIISIILPPTKSPRFTDFWKKKINMKCQNFAT